MLQSTQTNPPVNQRSLNVQNLLFPILLLAFLIIPQITSQVLLGRENGQSQLIQIAAEQTTLSQSISKTALEIQVAINDAARQQDQQNPQH